MNIGPTLADRIPPSTVGHKSFLEGDYKDSSLFLTSPEEITDIVTHMTTKRSSGFDNVSIEIIKLSSKYIAEPLSHLVNNSFMSGRVTASLKIAKVCPIFQSGNNADFTNYTGQYLFYRASIKYLKNSSISGS